MLYSRIVYVVVVILVFSRSCDGEDTAPASDAQIPTEEMPSLRVGAAHKSTESSDDTRLVDVFLDAAFMARLSKNLVPLCAEKADETNVAQSGLSCKQVNYLGEVQQYRRMFKPKADKEDIVRKAPVVVDHTVVDAAASSTREAPKLQYADLFEDYIVKRVAFKGTMGKKSEASFKPPGCDDAAVHPITLDKPLRDCAAYAAAGNGDGDGKFSVDKSVFVPTIAANSYFHRLSGHEVLRQYADSSSSSSVNTLGLDFASHWPTLLDVDNYQSEGGEGASPVHSCPLGAHMVMWNPGARAVDVQLIHATDSPKFGPKLGDSGSGSGKDKDASYLHYPRFSASGFGGLPDKVNPATVSLAHNEYLFAPNTVLVSVGKGGGDGGGVLMRSCFVDASNLNTFREALAGPAFLHGYGAAVEQIVNQAGFNASMDATPTDMSLRELRDAIARQVAKLSVATAGVEGGDATSTKQQQAEDGAADDENSSGGGGVGASGKRGRERGGGGRDRRDRRSRNTNVKGFIDSTKWRVLVEGLTVPPANTPVAHSIIFRAATIEWTSAFLPRKAEDAKFAFIITLCKYNPDSDDGDGEGNNDCTVLTEEPDSKALKRRVEGRVTAEDEGTTYFSHRFLKLEPGTQYFARVAYFYGENYPKPSPWVGITTPMLTPPLPLPELPFIETPHSGCTSVTLSVPSVEEEGGSSTSGYYVFARLLGPQHVKGMHAKKRYAHSLTDHATDWYFHKRVQISSSNLRQTNKGKDVVDVLYNDIVIDGLVPNNMYEFKMTPYNEIGKTDSLSHSTEAIGISCDGRKTPEAVVYASVYSLDDVDAGPLLTMNDTAQTLSCSDSEHSTVNVWGAHWNPNAFSVVGKTAHVKPIMLENAVFNPKEIAHTIAIVSRGAIPLVHKILKLQAAGAKGVVILDTGACKEYDHYCVAGSDKNSGDGWASEDVPEAWSLVRIPSMLIKRGDERFLGKCLGHPTYTPNNLKNEL
jgi:hypothetical protein